MSDQIRRNMPLFPISIVKTLTELSARQIRYYEEHGLIEPARTDGNKRLFSFNDVDKLLEIKKLLDQGVNIAGVKQIFAMKEFVQEQAVHNSNEKKEEELTDNQLRKLLKSELMGAGRFNRTSLRQGDMSRFFH